MSGKGVVVLDPQLLAEIPKCIIVELLSFVGDEDPRDSDTVDDVFLDKVLDIFLHNSGQWFDLNPFGEVVNPYDEELELQYGNGEGSYYVQSPLGE